MIIIAHRGNIDGPSVNENDPIWIDHVISMIIENKIQVTGLEIDVWFQDEKFFLGHNFPKFEISKGIEWFFEKKEYLWCHAKNIPAFEKLLNANYIKTFMHDKDDACLTSDGHIWTFPNSELPLTSRSIAVMPERTNWTFDEILSCQGVCTDYPNDMNKWHK